VNRSTLADQAYAQLRSAIVNGRLESGTPIIETELASMLSVSRTPIREALRRCELEGYVRRTEGGGLVVARPTAADITKLFAIREILEGYAVRLAADRISDGELALLEQYVVDDVKALRAHDIDRLAELNHQIHGLILEASRNRTLCTLMRGVRARAWGLDAFAVGSSSDNEMFVEEHARLAAMLRDGDSDGAELLIRTHLRRASDLLVSGLGSLPESNGARTIASDGSGRSDTAIATRKPDSP
jgi:DNA-binding GntR family transcriptional regulator